MILTRDADYGPTIEKRLYLNDHLKQEFKARVSKKRNVLLYSSASQALKHFEVKVSKETEQSESQFIKEVSPDIDVGRLLARRPSCGAMTLLPTLLLRKERGRPKLWPGSMHSWVQRTTGRSLLILRTRTRSRHH